MDAFDRLSHFDGTVKERASPVWKSASTYLWRVWLNCATGRSMPSTLPSKPPALFIDKNGGGAGVRLRRG